MAHKARGKNVGRREKSSISSEQVRESVLQVARPNTSRTLVPLCLSISRLLIQANPQNERESETEAVDSKYVRRVYIHANTNICERAVAAVFTASFDQTRGERAPRRAGHYYLLLAPAEEPKQNFRRRVLTRFRLFSH